MAKKPEIKIPLVTWRDGRPRYFPSPTAREKYGFKGEDLRHADTGAWFSVEEAIAWSEARQALMSKLDEDKTQKPARRKSPAATAKASGLATLAHVVTNYTDKNPRMQGKEVREGKKTRKPLAEKTVRNYKAAARLVEKLEDGRFWNDIAAAITPKNMELLLDRFEVKHGLSQTRQARAMLSQAYAFGIKKDLVRSNPVRLLEERLPTPAPRVRYGSIEAMKILVEACDLVGRPEIGDIVTQGLWVGQRQADRLNLTAPHHPPPLNIHFRQQKKGGQPLLIPIAGVLETRFAAARERRRDWRVNWPHVNLDERRRRPFNGQHYTHLFQEIRTAATYGIWRLADGSLASPIPKTVKLQHLKRTGLVTLKYVPAEPPALAPCPELDGFRDQDLRDTAVTWLALAGCEITEIAAITGHSLKTVTQILNHYFGLHPDLAKRAIGKLEAWYGKAEG